MMELIRSPKNRRVVAAAALARARERRRHRRMLLEGPNLVEEAAAGGVHLIEVFGLADDAGARTIAARTGAQYLACAPDVIRRLGSTENPRGPVAVATIPEGAAPIRDMMVVHVSDPGNAGTLIRTAAAFGLDVGFGSGAVDVWSPKVLRAAAGAHFRTTIAGTVGALPPGLGSIATVAAGGTPLPQLVSTLDPSRRWAILVGSEAHGLSPALVDSADVRITIPMPGGTESLNAAVAGSIVAYHFAIWRMSEEGSIAATNLPHPSTEPGNHGRA